MKKAFVLFCALLAFAACNIDLPELNTPVVDDNQEIKVNIKITRTEIEGATKATIKNGWAQNDVIFVFVQGQAAPKYLELKYNSGAWIANPKNDLALPASGTMTAVYLPYGSAYTVAADETNFTIKNSAVENYSGHFFICVNTPYTFDSEALTLSGTISLTAAAPTVSGEKLVHFDASGYTEGHTYDLYQDYMKPLQLTSIASDGTVNKTVGNKGEAIKGYVDAANSIMSFSGVLDATAVDSGKDYQFSINDVTACVLYTRDAGTKTVSANKYIGIGNISSTSVWNANEYVDLGIVNAKGEKVMWAKKNLGATTESGEGSYGKYYAWGELEGYALSGTYPDYTCNHTFANDANEILIDHFMNVKEDNSDTWRKTLKPEYDPAHVAMKGLWRMPTGYDRVSDGIFEGELARLKNNTTKTLTGTKGNVNLGITFTGNGNSIFLPLAGYVEGANVHLNDNENVYVANYISSTCETYWVNDVRYEATNVFYRLCMYTYGTGTSYSVTSSRESSGIGFTIRPVFSIK